MATGAVLQHQHSNNDQHQRWHTPAGSGTGSDIEYSHVTGDGSSAVLAATQRPRMMVLSLSAQHLSDAAGLLTEDPRTPTRASSHEVASETLSGFIDDDSDAQATPIVSKSAAMAAEHAGPGVRNGGGEDQDLDGLTAAALAMTPRSSDVTRCIVTSMASTSRHSHDELPYSSQIAAGSAIASDSSNNSSRVNTNAPPSRSNSGRSSQRSKPYPSSSSNHSLSNDMRIPSSSSLGAQLCLDSPNGSANRSPNASPMNEASPQSALSSPDGDLDRPLTGARSVALQRGDSTSSDSSVSGLSRASSSSSVYATPFRMTPFRTPAASMSRTASSYINAAGTTGSVAAAERNSYFPTVPAATRYPARGNAAGIVSNRNSFAGPSGGVRMGAGPSASGATAHDVAMHALVDKTGPAMFVSPASPLPSMTMRVGKNALAAQATAADSSNTRTPRPSVISLPPTPLGPDGYPLRPIAPPSPGAELLLLPTQRSSAGMAGFLAPIGGGRPMSRTSSASSIANMAHKRANDFELGEILGEGSYSTVFLATDKQPPHKQFALKVLDKKHIIKERKVKYVAVEKDTLARLDKHPGIIRLYWTFHDERSLYFVLELASNGEILEHIKELGSLEVDTARFYMAQVAAAVEYMHSKGVVHRDIKPENILLDSSMRIKITDFGSAKLLPISPSAEVVPSSAPDEHMSRSNSFVGTAQYVCPELLTAKPTPETIAKDGVQPDLPPPQAADMWAFGCVLYQFICGRTPFRAPNEYLIFQKITRLDYDFPEGFPEDAKDLVKKLLVLNPLERLGVRGGMSKIKSHPFFAGIDWSTLWTCQPPPMRTGMTPPQPLSRQAMLILEESSIDASSIDEEDEMGAEADAESFSVSSRPRLSTGVRPSTADRHRGSSSARQSMDSQRRTGLTLSTNVAGKQGSSDLPSPRYAFPSKYGASTDRDSSPNSPAHSKRGDTAFWQASSKSDRSVRSSVSSAGNPPSATSAGSLQRQQDASLTGHSSNGSSDTSNGHSRSRSSSSSRWSKILSVPKTAFQRVKGSARRGTLSPATAPAVPPTASPQEARPS